MNEQSGHKDVSGAKAGQAGQAGPVGQADQPVGDGAGKSAGSAGSAGSGVPAGGADSSGANHKAALLTLAIAAVCIIGLVVFAVMNTTGDGGRSADPSAGIGSGDGSGDSSDATVAMSQDEIAAVAGSGSLAGVRLPVLMHEGTGSSVGSGASGVQLVDMAEVLGGKPTVVNVWAWNCAPCRQELPLLQQWAQDNPDVQVVTVHAATEASRGQVFLQEIGVDLPAYSDTVDAVGSALNLPRVVPVTVIFRPDGSMATMHPGEFTSAEQITDVVRGALQ